MSAFVAGAEKRMMPVGEGAALRALREVCPQPLLLRRANVHRNAAVQSNDVPVAEVVAVVDFPRRARGGAEVVEITSGPCRVVIVVARDRPGASLEPTPRGVVAVLVVAARPIGIRVVPAGEHRSGDRRSEEQK